MSLAIVSIYFYFIIKEIEVENILGVFFRGIVLSWEWSLGSFVLRNSVLFIIGFFDTEIYKYII